MKNTLYILVSVVDREITTTVCKSHDEAWQMMFGELQQCKDWSDGWEDDYNQFKDENGYCDGIDGFAINENSGWANINGTDMNCDWSIVEISDYITRQDLISLAKTLIANNNLNEGMSSDDPLSANPYAAGVHDGILDIVSSTGIDTEKALNESMFN